MPGRVRLATVAGTRACRDVGAALEALDDAYKPKLVVQRPDY